MIEETAKEEVERQERVLLYALLTALVRLVPLPAAPDVVVGALRAYMIRDLGEELGLRSAAGSVLPKVTTQGPGALDVAASMGRTVGKTLLGGEKPLLELAAEVSGVFGMTVLVGREILDAASEGTPVLASQCLARLEEVVERPGRDLTEVSEAYVRALESMGDTGTLLIKEITKNLAQAAAGHLLHPDPAALGGSLAAALPRLYNQSRDGLDIMLSLLRVEVFRPGRRSP